jgi:hypothetical protein
MWGRVDQSVSPALELFTVSLGVHSTFLRLAWWWQSIVMGVQMFTPYDLRPTIEITAFTLTGVSTLVVATR